MNLIKISECGEGLDYECPLCGAEIGEPCSTEDEDNIGMGIELMLHIHTERYEMEKFNDKCKQI